MFSFNAREYQPGETPNNAAIWVGQLTKNETDAACPRHAEVQERTDYAADVTTREGNTWWSATLYGTAVHENLKAQIKALDDPNLLAETSYIKSRDAGYGERGSVRIDVLENVGNGTVCVYDIKTGKSGLTTARTAEIANEVHSYWALNGSSLSSQTRAQKTIMATGAKQDRAPTFVGHPVTMRFRHARNQAMQTQTPQVIRHLSGGDRFGLLSQ